MEEVTIIRQVDRREVMSHFIPIEREKMEMHPVDCSAMSTEELEDEVRTLCFSRGAIPFGIYLVGYGNDHPNNLIVRWVFGAIPVHELYSCGVNNSTDAILRKCNWNLLAARPQMPLSQMSKSIDGTKETIVTIKQHTPVKNGRFEVIDGFHRAMAMIQEGRKQIHSYIGLHKNDGFLIQEGQIKPTY